MNDDFFDGLTKDVVGLLTQYEETIEYICGCIAGIEVGDEFENVIMMKHHRFFDDYISVVRDIEKIRKVG